MSNDERARVPIVSAIIVLAVLLLAGCAGGLFEGQTSLSTPATQPGQSAAETQPSASGWDLSPRRNDARGVVIDVQPLGLGADQEVWEFNVALNTHSVNLDYNLTEVAVLRCERGQEYKPVSWEGSPPGGHHRQGVLRFASLDHPSSFLELVIQDVAGVSERIFRWETQETSTDLSPAPTRVGGVPSASESTVSSAEVHPRSDELQTGLCPSTSRRPSRKGK